MQLRLSLFILSLLLLSTTLSSPSSAAISFPTTSHLRHQLISNRLFKALAVPTSNTLPGFDPSKPLQFIQFPNGITVNLVGYGAVSLPAGYPIQSIPSYDAATNTIENPEIAAAYAYALSWAANPWYTTGTTGIDYSNWAGLETGALVPEMGSTAVTAGQILGTGQTVGTGTVDIGTGTGATGIGSGSVSNVTSAVNTGGSSTGIINNNNNTTNGLTAAAASASAFPSSSSGSLSVAVTGSTTSINSGSLATISFSLCTGLMVATMIVILL